MESIINKLFNGTTPQVEKLLETNDGTRDKLLKQAEIKLDSLFSALNEKQQTLFEEWHAIEDELWSDEVDRAYARGFKTGALLMIEVHDFKI